MDTIELPSPHWRWYWIEFILMIELSGNRLSTGHSMPEQTMKLSIVC